MKKLYFGDNLEILREYISSESVDLIYLDPPFNKQVQFNVLFRSPDSEKVAAQASAFRDTWLWGEEAERSYAEMMRFGGAAAKLLDALRSALGESDMMAYLTMMTLRLIELHRVAKAYRIALFTLRPDREPLPQNPSRCCFQQRELPK